MQVVIAEVGELARRGADAVERVLRERTDPVLGLATGSSPLPIYDELVRRHTEEGLSFALARAFLLDEYVGLPAEHPERYRHVIERELESRVDLDPERVQGPDGLAEDLAGACARYEDAIAAAGGVDVQILGIGTDGHIAFNEPGSSFASRTRVMPLTRQTREDNARYFDGDVEAVPARALTQGLGTIMAAGQIVLIAQGSGKAEAVHQMVEGAVSAMWPATILQHHPDVTVLLDEDAAGKLQLADHFREVVAAEGR
ncbi:MAG: glucosamine-6-phosphate deaminase [Actinomycetales bacterium]|nr:glucosamine-6-phosphate deaminase [Actinomycetales bacterium]